MIGAEAPVGWLLPVPGCPDRNDGVTLGLEPNVVDVWVDGAITPGKVTSPRPISMPSVRLTPALVLLLSLKIEPSLLLLPVYS